MCSDYEPRVCAVMRASRGPRDSRTMDFQSGLHAKRICLALAAGFSSLVLANPINPTVVAGSASFQSTGNALTITNANGTVIDWKGFSIGPGELTRFVQSNAASQVLNRVTGGDPSVILGALQSNGRVFLINQNGVAFGPGAQIDVGGFVVSSLGLSNADFLAGRLNFTQQDGAGGIVNQGVIRTATGGLIALIAPNVENHGVIQAPNGDVILAAGKSANLVDLQRPSIEVEVNAASNQALNVGQLVGRGIGIYAGAIRHSGVASANTASLDQKGRVVFKAVGDTLVSGRVEATNSVGGGGAVDILGDRVVLFDQATIDVSGVGAGGTALIGGNFQGKGPEQNANMTYVGKDVKINADAVGAGNGGKVIVWADGTTRFYGGISARGGNEGGNGGFVEVSGKGILAFGGTADRSAPRGSAGTLLLDPTDLTISATGPDTTEFDATNCLTAGCAVATETTSTLTTATLAAALVGGPVNVNATTGSGGGGGTINWTDGAVDASAHSLTLTGTTITFNGTLTNLNDLIFSTAPTGSGSATSSTGGSISGLFSTVFNLTGPTAGTAGGISFAGFAAADTTAVTGAVGFDDGLKSNQGMTFASVTTVGGTGTISNVAGSFADNTLVSAASGIDYAGFTGVTGTGTALTGMNGSFGDTTRISAASAVNYTGFALATVAGTGTALTGIATSFNDSTKVSGSGINYSGLGGLATVGGGATALTGIATSFNDSTKVSGSGINYSGLGSLATVAADGTADVTNTASFALTGPNAGTGASGIAYSAFNVASNTTAVTGAVGFDDTAKSSQGITFAAVTTVGGTGTISNVAGSFADNTLVSAASGIDYAGFTGVTGTGTALTGMNGSFGDTTRISAASAVNYTGFALATVAGTGTALTGIATSFNDSTKVSGSGINYSGLGGLATVGGGATALTGIATSFNDSTKVSGSGIDYSGLGSLATVAADGTADVTNTASFALTGPNAGTGASGIAYSAFNVASNTTAVTGAVGFDDGLKSNQGMTFASVTTVGGTGTISNVAGSFADNTLVSAASGIDYAGFTGVTGTGTALTGMNGSFGDTTRISAASAVNYTGFALATVAGTGTALTGVATSFNDSTRVSGSGINYSGLGGLATVAGDGTADVTNTASFALTGPNAGTGASGIAYSAFNVASNTTAVTGAVGFDDTAKSSQGITFAAVTTVGGTGTISNVAGSFADNTLVSAASGIDYAGFTGVTGTGTALTGMNGSFGDTTRISAASAVNYTGFALATVAGTGTALTGIATSFNDSTKVSGSGINYSGLGGLATVGGGATALTGIATSFNDSTKVSGSGINYSGLGSLATVAADGTADVTNTASFALTGPNAGTGASGIAYSAFNVASNTTAVTGAVGFDDTAKSSQGITFAAVTTVGGTGTISNVAGSFADNTLVSAASGIDYAGFTGVTGTGTALTGMNGSFGDTTRISAASAVNYTGFALATVAGTGTALTGIATSFNDSTKVSGSGINYSGLGGLATVGGGATALTGIATSFNDSTKVSGSGINYSGLGSLATVAADGTADVTNTASFALTGPNAGTGASGIAYSAFNVASNTTAVTGAVGFDDGLKSNQGMTFASATTVAGTGTISNIAGNFAIDTLLSAASGIDYAGFTAATGTGAGTLTGAGQNFNLTAANAGNNGTVSWTAFPNLTATGASTINGSVGSSLGGNLNGTSTTLGGTIQTVGTQTFTGAVTLNAATTLTSTAGGSITFGGALDGPFTLDVNTTGTTTFGGIVGGTNALATLTMAGGGITAINGGSITTSGAQSYVDAVVLGAAAALNSTGAGITAINGGNSAAGYGLALNTAGNATVRFDSFLLGVSSVGGNLDLTASGTIGQSGPLTVTGTTVLNAPGQGITLLAPANDFGGVVSASGSSIQLNDASNLSLGTVASTGNLAVTAGGLLDVSGTANGTTVSLKGVGLTNSSTITGTSSVTLDAGSGTLTNSGVITNAGAGSTAPIVLKGDSMALGGAVTGNAAPVTLTSGTAAQAISLIAGSGLILSQANLNLPTTTGGLIIGDALHTADITIGGTVATPAGSSGGFTINAGYDGVAGGGGSILDSGAGLLDMASSVSLKAHGDIGSAITPIHVGNVTSLATLSEAGNTHIGKTGALVIGGINGGGGQVFFTATGPITQTGPMLNVGSLHATVTGAGDITLQDNLNTVNFLYFDAPGALTYHQAADYTVVQALGNGLTLGSSGSIFLQSLSPSTPLNINAGSGDVTLTTAGAISISGPGAITARNITLTFPSSVSFAGGTTPHASNDLTIKATGNLTINAVALNITGGTTLAGAGEDLKNDVVIEAGGLLKITTTGDFTLGPDAINLLAGKGTATTTDPTAKAQANAFLSAGQLDLKVGGNFYIYGGKVILGGGEANASAIVLVKSGKAVDVTGNFVLTGGTITGAGTRATALAVFDPELPLEIKTGGSVAVVGGSAPLTSSSLLASASILNAGPIKFTIGGSGNFTHPVPAIAALLGPGIDAGLIVAGGGGSGLYDVFDHPVTSNDYPITHVFTGGGAFTVITDMTGYANALIQSRAPLGIDESLMAYINFAINTETIAKGRRGTSDQGNFKRRTAGQCS
jgi:filamentous hemagglutinin family protein